MKDMCRDDRFDSLIPTPISTSVPSENPSYWYALKVFHNRMGAVVEELSPDGIECYIPTHTVMTERRGIRYKEQKPVIASLMFFRSTMDQAEAVGRRLTDRAILYTRRTETGQRIPAAIPEREMDIFRLVVSSGADGLEYLPDDPERYRRGDLVRVTAGPLAGAEGHIARIRGDRRLVVSVRGICAVATAYIPQCFLEKL